MRLQKTVQLIEHDARADVDASVFEIEIGDLAVVARKINDHSFANGISNQTRTGTARRDGKTRICRGTDDKARLLRAFRKSDADWFDLINRRVRRVQLTRQIIKARVATGLLDFPFLRGSHVVILSEAKNLGFEENIRDVALRST
jgi:hypothetical protein